MYMGLHIEAAPTPGPEDAIDDEFVECPWNRGADRRNEKQNRTQDQHIPPAKTIAQHRLR